MRHLQKPSTELHEGQEPRSYIIKKFFQDAIIHDKGNQYMSHNAVWFPQILPNTFNTYHLPNTYYQPDNFASPLGDGAPEGRGWTKG